MATLDNVLSALKKADAAGDIAGARILADQYRKMIGSKPESQQGPSPEPRGFTPFINQGIASTLGAPVDLVNAGLGAIGLPVSNEPFAGSSSIMRGMQSVGISPAGPSARPETLPEYIGRGVGGAAGALLPGAGVVGVASRSAPPVISGAAQSISRPFIASPGRALAAEATSGAGSGVGESVAGRLSPESTGGQITGSLIGGVAGGMLPAAMMRFSPTRAVANFATSQFAPFTEAGGFDRARRRMQSLVENRDAARSGLEGETLGGLSPAAATNDPRLMALERSVRDSNPQIDLVMRENERRAASGLVDIAYLNVGDTTVQQARDALANRIDDVNKRMDDRLSRAIEQSRNKVESLSPDAPPSSYSTIVRNELESALKASRAQEREMWEAVPENVGVGIVNSRDQYRSIINDTPRARRDDIPEKAKSFLASRNGFKDVEPVKEVHGLYSAMREESRIARADGKANKARISDRIADALMSDLEATPSVNDPLAAAIVFSRRLNETYRQGDIGRILGSEKTGADRIAPELTLDATLGQGGIRGALAIDNLRDAAKGALPEVDSYIASQFSRSAVRDGRVSPQRADRFLTNNREMLDRVPDVRRSIVDALTAQSAADKLSGRFTDLSKRLSRGAASVFSEARPGEEVSAISRSRNPAYYARQAMLQAKDKGDGVKRAFLDDLFDKARVGPGNESVSGGRILKAVSDPTYREALSQVLSPDEMARLGRVGDEMARIEAMRGRLPNVGSIMGDMPDTLVSYLVRIMAARGGARLGRGTGASLQTAGFASGRARKLLENLNRNRAEELIVKAISGDKELFDALLMPASQITKRQETRLIETLTGMAGSQTANKDKGE